MMEKQYISRLELLVLLFSVSFFPLMSLMIGDAMVAIISPKSGVIKMMFGERISFAIIAILFWMGLTRIGIIDVKEGKIISCRDFVFYILQVLVITVIVFYNTSMNVSILYTLFFIVLNFLIAWEEELVYRLLVPAILKKIYLSSIIICLIQSLIFSYIGHLDGTFLENLLFRVPIAILFYLVKDKTKSIFLPTVLHSLWNIVLHFI